MRGLGAAPGFLRKSVAGSDLMDTLKAISLPQPCEP